jgi:formate-nitrite transporter family protein
MEESQQDTTRRSAADILEVVKDTAVEELDRSSSKLAFSGIAGGLAMGLTPMAVGVVRTYLPADKVGELISGLLYPLGFITVIVGRQQLFTENTPHPVAYFLSTHTRLGDGARLWVTVWVGNVIGAFLFALLAMRTGALSDAFSAAIAKLGTTAVEGSFAHLFWGAVISGWMVALAAWIVEASHWTSGQMIAIWTLTFPIGLLKIPHSIAGSAEILSAVLAGSVSLGHYGYWMAAATLGNAVGGVVIVSVLNWAQAEK